MNVAILFFVIFILISSTVNVNSQTCKVTPGYDSCSSNSACGCLPIASANNIGICAPVGVSCSQLTPCQLPDSTCEKSDHICVFHSRCDSNPICYPMALLHQKLCPSLTSSTTISPPINVISNYSSELTIDDGNFFRPGSSSPGYYYEAIHIVVGTTGTYNLTSFSGIDTYGFLYNGTFNPSYPTDNLIGQDDEIGGNNQFKLTAFLEAGVPYTLVVSTYIPGVTGPFSVVASGPNDVYFIPINIMQTTTTTTTATSFMSNYSSALTVNSEMYLRNENSTSNSYYEAIQLNVNTTEIYTFTSKSNIDTYGYLYQGNFYPSYPSLNVLEDDDDTGGNSQFQLISFLRADLTYILVVTTFSENITGPFSVVASGPDNVNFIPINKI